MALFDFFRRNSSTTEKKEPTISGFSLGGISVLYDISFSSFYKFYEENPYVASVIDRIRSDVGAYWYEIRRNDKLDDSKMKEFKKLVNVTLGSRPREFIKRILRDYEVTGNAYVYLSYEWTKVVGLQVLDPRFIKPIMRENGEIIGYVQNLGWYKCFTKDEIFHLKTDSDLSYEALGRSKMRSLFVDLESDGQAKESNLAFFLNNQTPSSLVILDPAFKLPTDPMAEIRFRKEIRDVFESGKYAGGKNRHRSAIIEWVKDVMKLQDKISDAEFLLLRRFTLELVCSVYGVNKDILGFTEHSNRSTWENQSSNYFSLIEEKENLLDEFMTDILSKAFGEEYTFCTIKDNIRLLEARSAVAIKLYSSRLVTLNEGRAIVQYEKTANGDTIKSETKENEKKEN